MTAMELLNWSRGPALQIATIVFVVGMVVRVLEILLLGRKQDLSEPRAGGVLPGIRTIMTRNVPIKGMWHVAIPGYIWHLGFFIVLLFFAPHIQFFKDSFGLSWPALSNPVIDLITVITMAIMIYTLYRRYSHPVRRKLATIGDYFVWLVSLLPVLTGYMAFHRVGADYTLMLAIHILSVNLLLVVFPFTKLTHAVTFLLARWYNGAANGRKGVQV